jgi:D-aminoacyl-tRNA deacylase
VKVVLQRVRRASVRVDDREVAAIGRGLLVLLCVLRGDGPDQARRLAERVALWRCFPDESGRMNLDVGAVEGALLVVSQFTLAADGRKGRRPSFDAAAEPALAEELYETFFATLAQRGLPTARGVFGADMQVELVNDGPVTFALDEPPPAP